MSDFIWKVPKGDSRSARFTVTVDGALLDLTGYTVTLTVKHAVTDVAALFTETGTLQSPSTSSLIVLHSANTGTPGYYVAAISASKAGSGPYTATGSLTVEDHA